MPISRKSVLFISVIAFLHGFVMLSCSDDNDDKGRDYVKFTIKSKTKEWRSTDSTSQRCELHVGSSQKLIFSYDQTFKSHDSDWYALTIDIINSSKECPYTTLDNTSQFTFDLAMQNSSKKFIDYTSKPDFNVVWQQRYENRKIIITGNFQGWLYQYFDTRPDGSGVTPEQKLIDSVYVESGQFQISTLN